MSLSASFVVLSPGNLAIQTEAWTVPVEAAKAVRAVAKRMGRLTPGGYWAAHLGRPVNVAVRTGAEVVKLYTAGFTTPELCAMFREAGVTVEAVA